MKCQVRCSWSLGQSLRCATKNWQRQIFDIFVICSFWQQTSWHDRNMIGTCDNSMFSAPPISDLSALTYGRRWFSLMFSKVGNDGRKLGWSAMIDGWEPCWQLFLLPIFEEDLRTGSACLCIRSNVNLAKANILRIPNDTKICKQMQNVINPLFVSICFQFASACIVKTFLCGSQLVKNLFSFLSISILGTCEAAQNKEGWKNGGRKRTNMKICRYSSDIIPIFARFIKICP